MSEINLMGGQAAASTGGNKNYVGLGAVKMVAFQPNRKELEALLGKDLERDPDYSIKDNPDGSKNRPLSFWFENSEGKLISERIYVSNQPITTKNKDKFKFINEVGQVSYFAATSEEIANNPKVNKWYKPNGMRKLMEGEDTLYSLLQQFVRYDSRAEGANWLQTMNNIGLTAENLYNGNYDGMKKFLAYIQQNDNQCVILHAVRRRETDEGVRYNQQLILREETMFRTTDGQVMEWMIGKLKDFRSGQIAAGYDITKSDYLVGPLTIYQASDFETSQEDMPSEAVGKFIDI
jgi:hypothetical protein